MSTARILRIKAAQNQLIAACGGIDGAVDALEGKFGRSTVGRWNDLGDPTLMPLTAVLDLQAHTNQPMIASALAELCGRRLADPDGAIVKQASAMAQHAEAIMHAGELMAAGAQAFADGKVTPNEATAIDRAAGLLEQAVAAYRKTLAGIRADGGLSVVEGGR
ncbi:MAG: hypothetical protein Rhirs2KO_09780 [Rhizobiaceae bacterium]